MLARPSKVKRYFEMHALYADTRLGGLTRLVYGDPRRALMRVPDSLKYCVCYVCTKKGEGWVCGGTAFFVSKESSTHFHTYVVTAKHNLKKIEELGCDVYLRVNLLGGKVDFIKIESEWFYPDSPAVDVAVLPFTPADNIVYQHIPVETIVTDKIIEYYGGIGIGSDVLVSGLFTLRQGTQKNYPIIRSGIIAAMLDEQLPDVDNGGMYDAYLIEIRSVGGFSGSPVFVYFEVEDPKPHRFNIYLLGVIRGHWNFNVPTVQPAFASQDDMINAGIAMVTPAEEISKILEYDKLIKQRRERDREVAKKTAPTLD